MAPKLHVLLGDGASGLLCTGCQGRRVLHLHALDDSAVGFHSNVCLFKNVD